MSIFQKFFSKIFILVLVAQSQLALLSPEKKIELEDLLESKNFAERYRIAILETLGEFDLLGEYSVIGFIDYKMKGFNFHIAKGNENFVAKIFVDNSNHFGNCREDKLIDDLQKLKVSYLSTKVKYGQFEGLTDDGERVYTCVTIYEKPDTDLSRSDLFSHEQPNDYKENSAKLFRFFGKVIQSFAELNFKARILHGDIRPENIKVKISSDGDFDPEIANFDLMLENLSGEKVLDYAFRYDPSYRSPELAETIKIDEETNREYWDNSEKDYYFSEEFIEDVYALGKTIKNVLPKQKDFINDDQCEIIGLKDLASQMTKNKEEITERVGSDNIRSLIVSKGRPNMKEALQSVIGIMIQCQMDKDGGRNQVFFEQATKSLESLLANRVVI